MKPPTSPLEATFFAALEKDSPAERAAYLDQACGDDLALRKQVERMLAANAKAGSFLEAAADGIDRAGILSAVAEGPGSTIGRYKLMEEIAEGGMGVVYRAEQQEPVRRTVALKIIKPGMDTREVIARFGSERQALAMMDHPNIARVFDAGETESGRPFFAMELVDGKLLTEYCDQQQLATAQRLELFIQVCMAVQHAHQKGIIHRDLKPSNVLVAPYDGMPVPKIIDFGISKAVHSQPSAAAITTGLGRMIGTPLYMSPEQAGRGGLDVDTRSDIYSLGVMLYELLTGSTPFDPTRAQTADYDEIRRMIREEEPLRPSARISTLGEAATTVSTCRKTEPVKLGRLLRGDLDWIVMRALEKDPARRYQTAADFARDVERHLAHAPVHAGPPGKWYRARKFMRRFRAPLAIGTGFVALLMAITIIAVRGYYREAKLRADTETANVHAGQEAEIAKNNFKLARDAVKKYYTNVANDPRLKPHDLEKLKHDLLRSANEYYEKMVSKDSDDADLQHDRVGALIACGEVEADLGNSSGAETTFDTALTAAKRLAETGGADVDNQSDLARIHSDLYLIYWKTGRLKEAETAATQALALRRALAGEHPDDPKSQYGVAHALGNLAVLYMGSGRNSEAERTFKEAIAIGRALAGKYPDAPEYQAELSGTLGDLGVLYMHSGRGNDAQAAYNDALAIRKSLAEKHSDVPEYQKDLAGSQNNLGLLYQDRGQGKEAEAAYKEAIAIWKALAEGHPDVPEYQSALATGYSNLGLSLNLNGRSKDAESPDKEAVRIGKILLQKHPDVPEYQDNLAHNQCNLGEVFTLTGKFKDAESPLHEALAMLKTLVKKHPEIPDYQFHLATTYAMLGNLEHDQKTGHADEAVRNYKESIAVLRTIVEKHPEVPSYQRHLADYCRFLGDIYALADRCKDAEGPYKEALAVGKSLVEKYPDVRDYQELLISTCAAYGSLGIRYVDAFRPKDAENVFTEDRVIWKNLAKALPTDAEIQKNVAITSENLGTLYRDTGRPKEAEAAYDDALAILKNLVAQHAAEQRYRDDLLLVYEQRAMLYYRTCRDKERRAVVESATFPIYKSTYESHPENSEYRMRLAGTYYLLGLFRATPLPEVDTNRGPTRSAESAMSLATKAIGYFQQACDLGYFDNPKTLGAMQSDDDLRGLREGPGYKKLLERIAARVSAGKDHSFDQCFGCAAMNYVERGTYRFEHGQPDKAEENFKDALRLNPYCGGMYCGRGDEYKNANELDLALLEYRKAFRLDPKQYTATFLAQLPSPGGKPALDQILTDFHQLLQLRSEVDPVWLRWVSWWLPTVTRGTDKLPGTVFASDMPWVRSSCAFESPEATRDRDSRSTPLHTGGLPQMKGIWTHAFSDPTASADVVIDISRNKFAVFKAQAGLENDGHVQFQVAVDGETKFKSGLMRFGNVASISVDVAGAKEIVLRVLNDGGSGNSGDSVCWGDARFIEAGAADPLEEPPAALRSATEANAALFLAEVHLRLGNKDLARRWFETDKWMAKNETDENLRQFRSEAAKLLRAAGVEVNDPR